MWKKYVSFCVSAFFTCLNVCAQSAWMEWEEQIGEEADLSSWEEQYENLSELAEHPFNINMVTKEELEQLPFLIFFTMCINMDRWSVLMNYGEWKEWISRLKCS